MAAGRADIKNRLDIRLDAVFFGDIDQRLEIDVDIILILCPRIVHQNFHILYLWKRLFVPDVALIMGICVTFNRRRLTVNADNRMSPINKHLCNGFADAL